MHPTENSPDLLDQHIATTPAELDLAELETVEQLSRALRCYAKMATRPRKASAWAWIACELWNARQDAMRSGALVKYRADGTYTDDYELVSSRYRDAQQRVDLGRAWERHGESDVRI